MRFGQNACDPERLKRFLDDALSAKQQLELSKHLDHCEPCQRALETLAAGSVMWRALPALGEADETGAAASVAASAKGWVPGGAMGRENLDFLELTDDPAYLGKLGPYLVLSVLGEGGMGVVLKAFDPALSRVVAVKVLAPAMAASGAARRRFSREAKAAAAVVHDHVVAIYAVDRDAHSGLPYLVMPYIAGPSLQQRIDEDGPLEPEEVLRIGMQTALGLAAAHAQGLVHRDIKPSNILLENGLERVKITDFGLARAVDDASQTQSGVVAGTPQYMAPEQARGELVDHKADLFSLGSVLYAMCTGHAPFRAKTMMGVLRRVCDEAPRPVREINPEVPRELVAIIEKLHAKDPAKRFGSASAAAEALGRQLARQQRPSGRVVADRGLALGRAAKRLADYTKGPTAEGAQIKQPRLGAVAWSAVVIVALVAIAELVGPSGPVSQFAGILPGARALSGIFGATGGDERVEGRRRINVHFQDGSPVIEASGKLETRNWDVSEFRGLNVSHGFRADITRGDQFAVAVTADDNVIKHVKVTKQGNVLRITLEDGFSYRLNGDSPRVAIVMPDLESLDLSHGSKGIVNGFMFKHAFLAKLSHGSVLEGTIATGPMTLNLSHGSEVKLGGTAGDVKLGGQHGSEFLLDGLKVGNADVRLEHGSSARIHADGDGRTRGELTHGSHLNGSARAKTVELNAGFGSRVELTGAAVSGTITGGHSSQFALGELVIKDGVVRIDDGTVGTVNVSKHLLYHVGNSARLSYLGHPTASGSVSKQGSAKAIAAGEAGPVGERPAAVVKPVPAVAAVSEPRQQQRRMNISVGRRHLFGQATVVGSGRVASKDVVLNEFRAVTIDRSITAEVVRSATFGVTLTADDNILEHIETVLKNGTLLVRLADGSYSMNVRPRVQIRLPDLDAIRVDGASEATIAEFASDRALKVRIDGASKLSGSVRAGDLDVEADGASSVSLQGAGRNAKIAADGSSRVDLGGFALMAEAVKVDLDGASSVRLTGSARSLTLSGEGSSQFAIAELPVEIAIVKLEGASRADISVRALLDYNISGGSTLKYKGEPTIGQSERSGGATVSH